MTVRVEPTALVITRGLGEVAVLDWDSVTCMLVMALLEMRHDLDSYLLGDVELHVSRPEGTVSAVGIKRHVKYRHPVLPP